jgi:hypothetical protein
MYMAMILFLLALDGWLIKSGVKNRRGVQTAVGTLVAAAVLIFFSLLSLWGELLWFGSLGYGDRF